MKISLGGRVAVPLEDPGGEAGVGRSMSPGSTTTRSAAMISCSVARSTPATRGPGGGPGRRGPRPCTPWYAMCSRPRWKAKLRCRPPSPARRPSAPPGRRRRGSRCSRRAPRRRRRRRRTRHPRGRASPTASSTAARVTTSSAHTSTYLGSPKSFIRSCGRCRRWRVALHVLGRGDDRRGPALVQRAAREVERQAQAEADAGPTSRTPSRTFSGVSRLMRPSSSSSPQSPQVEPSGRRCHRVVMRCNVPTGCPSLVRFAQSENVFSAGGRRQ